MIAVLHGPFLRGDTTLQLSRIASSLEWSVSTALRNRLLEKLHQLEHRSVGIVEAHERLLAAGEARRDRFRDEPNAARFELGRHGSQACATQAQARDPRVAEVGVGSAVRARRLPFDEVDQRAAWLVTQAQQLGATDRRVHAEAGKTPSRNVDDLPEAEHLVERQ